jgi:hypothetical protein
MPIAFAMQVCWIGWFSGAMMSMAFSGQIVGGKSGGGKE